MAHKSLRTTKLAPPAQFISTGPSFHDTKLLLTTHRSNGPPESPFFSDQFVQMHHVPYQVHGQPKEFLRFEVWDRGVRMCKFCHRKCNWGPCACFLRAHKFLCAHKQRVGVVLLPLDVLHKGGFAYHPLRNPGRVGQDYDDIGSLGLMITEG